MERKPDWLPDFPVQIYCNREMLYETFMFRYYYAVNFVFIDSDRIRGGLCAYKRTARKFFNCGLRK